MKNLFPLLVTAFLFAGCEKIEGQLNVTKELQLKTSKGSLKTLREGTYSADIRAVSSKKITLKLDDDTKYPFSVPKGIPDNGSFSYKSATIGQPVDISGVVATKVTDSNRRQTTESCEYREAVRVCTNTPKGEVCSIQYQTRYGIQWVEYFDRRIDRDVNLSIAPAGTNSESAHFQGENSWIERIIVSEGQCR